MVEFNEKLISDIFKSVGNNRSIDSHTVSELHSLHSETTTNLLDYIKALREENDSLLIQLHGKLTTDQGS